MRAQFTDLPALLKRLDKPDAPRAKEDHMQFLLDEAKTRRGWLKNNITRAQERGAVAVELDEIELDLL